MNLINDNFIDDIITNLKIIGMVQKNDKLSISTGHLKIDKEDHVQFVRRWLNRDSRESTILFIKNVMKNLNDLITRLEIFEIDDKIWIVKRIVSELENVEVGIKNLKITYVNDSYVCVNLDNILSKLKDITQKYIDRDQNKDIKFVDKDLKYVLKENLKHK